MNNKMNINSVFALFGLVLLLASCGDKNTGYAIKGDFKECPDSSMVILLSHLTEENIDTAYVVNGKLEMDGRVEIPQRVSLIVNTNPVINGERAEDGKNMYGIQFYLENSPIHVQVDLLKLPGMNLAEGVTPEEAVITGSKTQDLYKEYTRIAQKEREALKEVNQAMMNDYYMPKFKGEDVPDSIGINLVRRSDQLNAQNRVLLTSFIKDHLNSIVSIDLVMDELTYGTNTVDQIDSLVNLFPSTLENAPYVDKLKGVAEKVSKLAPGTMLQDINVLSVKGDTVSLKSMIPTDKKYVMLEFWASWCGPCRMEIPHLKKVYEKYGKNDFAIVSVSLDEDEKAWLKAVNEEKMTWLQFRNPGGFRGTAVTTYGIQGVPTCIILNNEGKVEKINMRGPYLDNFLLEYVDKP